MHEKGNEGRPGNEAKLHPHTLVLGLVLSKECLHFLCIQLYQFVVELGCSVKPLFDDMFLLEGRTIIHVHCTGQKGRWPPTSELSSFMISNINFNVASASNI